LLLLSCLKVEIKSGEMSWAEFVDKPASVCIYSLKSKNELFSFQPNLLLQPNSIVKILTSALSADELGEDFCFATSIGITGKISNSRLEGNLVITGDGDPTLGSLRLGGFADFFEYIYTSLVSKNIKTIEGDVLFPDIVFDEEKTHHTWLESDIGNYYGCGVHSFNFMENSFEVYFKLGEKGHPSQIIKTYPTLPGTEIINQVFTGEDHIGDRACIYKGSCPNKILIKGKLGSVSKTFSIKGAIPSPERVCYDYLVRYLENKGIKVLKKAYNTKELQEIGSYRSLRLKDILRLMHQSSINLYAEALFKKVSQKVYGVGSFSKSQELLKKMLKQEKTQEYFIVDGSGLSTANKLSCQQMVKFLKDSYECSNKKLLNQVLPKTSSQERSGLSKWFSEAKYEGVIQGKTGSSSKGRSVAGYITCPLGNVYCFCAIENLQDPHLSCIFKERLKQVLDLLIFGGVI
jgi:D-alanyl-D-alanine carboxypeptidase/D-alanyl-D-alanine-endopeptidase (penicillin-binding protein 4)